MSRKKRKPWTKTNQPKASSTVRSPDWIVGSQGESGIDYQRAAQITWWSILQGVAVGLLVTQISSLITYNPQDAVWHLWIYVVVAIFIVVNSWVQMAWVILISKWQITLVHTTAVLFLGIAVSLVCLFVDSPKYFISAVSFLVACAVIIYCYNIRNRTQVGLSVDRVWRIIALYTFFGLLCLAGAVNLFFAPSKSAEIVWGFALLAAVLLSLKVQEVQMKYERLSRNVP